LFFNIVLIIRMDIATAIILGLRPRFKIANIAPHPNLDILLATRYKTKLSNLTGLQDLSQEAIEVYAMLRHLIMEKEKVIAAQSSKVTDEEFDLFLSYSQLLMHRLAALIQFSNSPKPGQNVEIFRLLGNAGLAHIFMFTSKHPRGHIRIFISTQIRIILETIDIRSFQIAYPEVWLGPMSLSRCPLSAQEARS
jgi:hypothetical protein